MKRIAPDGGYKFGNKRRYRRDIWGLLRRELSSEISLSPVCLMPSIEGSEIESAKTAGFRESNLHVVDRNPAIVATLKRRYPAIKTYGVDVRRAFGRMSDVGLRAANIDLCACVSVPVIETASAMFTSSALADDAWIAFTVQRGREPREITSWLKQMEEWTQTDAIAFRSDPRCVTRRKPTARDIARMHLVLLHGGVVLDRVWVLKRLGIYRSNKVTMLWFVIRSMSAAFCDKQLMWAHRRSGIDASSSASDVRSWMHRVRADSSSGWSTVGDIVAARRTLNRVLLSVGRPLRYPVEELSRGGVYEDMGTVLKKAVLA